MQIHFRKSEEFPECTGMANNAEHGPLRAMPPESFSAPFAPTACEIDFTNNTAPHKTGRIRFRDFTNEFVSRRSAKPVVAALEFKVGVAHTRTKQTDERKSLGSLRLPLVSESYLPFFEMDREHP